MHKRSQMSLFDDLPLCRDVPFVFGDAVVRGQFRFALRRWWRAGEPLVWIMCNPSCADENIDDPTLKRVIHFSQAWGFPGLIVLNLVPYRSSSPKTCADWYVNALDNGTWGEVAELNWSTLNQALSKFKTFVFAWGHVPSQLAELESELAHNILGRVEAHELTNHRFYCLGHTKHGWPIHPLARGKHRVPDDQMPVEYWL